jgi:CubicO group peptidase (beta-lactamase class C family)
MSADPLLASTLGEVVETLSIPGLAAAVVLDGELAGVAAFGVRSLETRDPVTPDTIFRIGSTSKPMTGTLVMQLVDQGRLDLDTPIRRYLPDLRLSWPDAAGQITLRHLLTHQSGLPTAAVEHGWREPDGLGKHVREVIARVRFVAPPATFYSYSNLGLDLAGYICEAVTGIAFDELLAERVLRPAGMAHTTLDPLVAMTYPLAQAHSAGEPSAVLHRFPENTGHHPAGFVMSTVVDMARFARLHLGDGEIDGCRIISADAAKEMRKAQLSLRLIDGTCSGLTFGIRRYKGVTTVSHDGGISGFGSHFFLVPERGAAISILYNRLTLPIHARLYEAITNIFDGLLGLKDEHAVPAAAPVQPRPERWPALTGTYLGLGRGLVDVRVQKGSLVAEVNGREVALKEVADELFSADGQSFAFVTLPGEDAARYLLVDTAPCERDDSVEPVALSPGELTAYAGGYGGDDTLTIDHDENGLWLTLARFGETNRMRCVPLGNDRFASDVGVLEFRQRPEDNRYDVTIGGADVYHPTDRG